MFGWLHCAFLGCREKVLFETKKGVGFKCLRCGDVYDWMKWEELLHAKTWIEHHAPATTHEADIVDMTPTTAKIGAVIKLPRQDTLR